MDVIAEFDYTAQESDELSIQRGDIINHVQTLCYGWYEGTLNGKRGAFPSDFVTVLEKTTGTTAEVNILLLGETGVGKSTWINAFFSFLKYASFQDAVAGELLSPIPSKFSVVVENFQQIEVNTGSDENEIHQTGHSATQEARVYPFNFGDTTIRLIDTPGIGDTRGIDQDKKNFQSILATLSQLEEIHGICILLKSNNSRLSVMFRFCIQELLANLHRDASKNIVFCFTNTRGTFYRPGDSMPALMTLLQENKEVHIPVGKETVYCFDSEAYRFLAAVKNNPPVRFSPGERENFAGSWDKSFLETMRMLQHIRGLVPHPIQSTLNLNYFRALLLKLARPLAEISRNIQMNRVILEKEKAEIQETRASFDELEKMRMTTRTDIKITRLEYPKMVCKHSDCVRISSVREGIEEVQSAEYITICHDKCRLPWVKEDSIGSPLLLLCSAMSLGKCKGCGHSYKDHLHVYYDSILVVTHAEVVAVRESMAENLDASEMKRKMIEEKVVSIAEYEYELSEIEKASVKFAYFLKVNAITPYNDGMEMYLDHLISEEENKMNLSGNRKTLNSLLSSKESYKYEKSILEQQIKNGGGRGPTLEEVEELVNKLKSLKHSGNVLTEALDCVHYAARQVFNEEVVKPPPKKLTEGDNNVSKLKQFWEGIFAN